MTSRGRLSCRRRRQRGMTLWEVTLVILILTVALTGLISTVATSSVARIRLERRSLAIEAVQSRAAEIEQMPLDDLVAQFAGGVGAFSIPGLDGAVPAGSVLLVLDETVTDAALGMSLGMPRDLDGDGFATQIDVSAGALALPAVVQAQWTTGGTTESFRYPVIVYR